MPDPFVRMALLYGNAAGAYRDDPEIFSLYEAGLAPFVMKKMVEDGRSCTEVLIQLAAVSGSLKSVSRVILRDHMEHCFVDAIERGDHTELEELNRAIDQLMK